MRGLTRVIMLLVFITGAAQSDFSDDWEDMYSYNNVKDFIEIDSKIYALVDNAVFVYDVESEYLEKISSVNGLSGEVATSLFYSEKFKKLIIGYDSGLLEIVGKNNKIFTAPDIKNFPLSTEKSINAITEYEDKLYLSTSFAVIVYDINEQKFGDTYFIGLGSTERRINQVEVSNNIIYAAAEDGIYVADVNNPNLVDYNNWTKYYNQDFSGIDAFNGEVYTASNSTLYQFNGTSTLDVFNVYSSEIKGFKGSSSNLSVALSKSSFNYDLQLNLISTITSDPNSEYDFELNTSYAENGIVYLCSSKFGILETNLSGTNNFSEIHPEGPISNNIFSLTVNNNIIWTVYGGYDISYTPINSTRFYSKYDGQVWKTFSENENFPAKGLVHTTIDPFHENRVYISAWSQTSTAPYDDAGGILVVENDSPKVFWNQFNSGLEDLAPSNSNYASVRVDASVFDAEGNLWVTNSWIDRMLKRYSPSGSWTSYNLSSLVNNEPKINGIEIDKSGNKWMSTGSTGVLVFNEDGNRQRALTTEVTKGSLPSINVKTVAIDNSNKIWIGTTSGLVVYEDGTDIFNSSIYDAEPVIITDEGGTPKKLLDEEQINSIAIDGANNKWFATDRGGVLQTNPSGTETLNLFNTDNSPLPSNRVIKVKTDISNGNVYFVTDKGTVIYKNGIASYGESLTDVYAYPNPATKNHEYVTIDGRNGNHLPEGTNVKILDASGYLVYETNVEEGQELQGGKVVWDKTNLAGRKVASGIYIVLLTTKDNSETTSAKIAIVN